VKRFLFVLGLIAPAPALALSPAAEEFMAISTQLEPVQCEKRRLRREIALAEAERRDQDVRVLRKKFTALNADPKTAQLEKRLSELEPRVKASRDPEDLAAISLQQRQAFYRCD
jgi:hypothetical protein